MRFICINKGKIKNEKKFIFFCEKHSHKIFHIVNVYFEMKKII